MAINRDPYVVTIQVSYGRFVLDNEIKVSVESDQGDFVLIDGSPAFVARDVWWFVGALLRSIERFGPVGAAAWLRSPEALGKLPH